jgi:hypothetical protein
MYVKLEIFQLKKCDYADMSPVVIPSGYTRSFLDGEITVQSQLDKIHRSFDRITASNDVRTPSYIYILLISLIYLNIYVYSLP